MNSVGGEILVTLFGIFAIYTWWGETYSDSWDAYLGQIRLFIIEGVGVVCGVRRVVAG